MLIFIIRSSLHPHMKHTTTLVIISNCNTCIIKVYFQLIRSSVIIAVKPASAQKNSINQCIDTTIIITNLMHVYNKLLCPCQELMMNRLPKFIRSSRHQQSAARIHATAKFLKKICPPIRKGQARLHMFFGQILYK